MEPRSISFNLCNVRISFRRSSVIDRMKRSPNLAWQPSVVAHLKIRFRARTSKKHHSAETKQSQDLQFKISLLYYCFHLQRYLLRKPHQGTTPSCTTCSGTDAEVYLAAKQLDVLGLPQNQACTTGKHVNQQV